MPKAKKKKAKPVANCLSQLEYGDKIMFNGQAFYFVSSVERKTQPSFWTDPDGFGTYTDAVERTHTIQMVMQKEKPIP
jgi:hypothetical protein